MQLVNEHTVHALLSLIRARSYIITSMRPFGHPTNPLNAEESASLLTLVRRISDSTLARRFIPSSGPLGAGTQTVPSDTLVSITDGVKSTIGGAVSAVRPGIRSSGLVPLIWKDFVIHWRDLEQSRQNRSLGLSTAKAAAAAACCARSEDQLVLFGEASLGYEGLMNIAGRNRLDGRRWTEPGDAFQNFSAITQLLTRAGHSGPYAAVVSPKIYSNMHCVLKGSPLLEVAHVRALLTAGVFSSPILRYESGLVLSTGKQNAELLISVDTSLAFLGSKQMNLPFRVFKAVYLNVKRPDSIYVFGDDARLYQSPRLDRVGRMKMGRKQHG